MACPVSVAQTADLVNGKWVEQNILLAPDLKVGDRFGDAVAIHRAQITVGAPGASSQVRCAQRVCVSCPMPVSHPGEHRVAPLLALVSRHGVCHSRTRTGRLSRVP